MTKTLLDYNFPKDLKTMTAKELELLSYEIRSFIIESVSQTGGHLASNLGVVELSLALHKVFTTPKDKLIWDVGHQSYIHKILTGRANSFHTLRQYGGMSGFPKREESEHDFFDTGHSSTSISAAAAFAVARDIKGESFDVVAVIGDGSMTGGLAYEGLNNAGDSKSKIIVILNDNEMSIGQNTGSLSQHLSKLRMSHAYLDIKKQVKKTLRGMPAGIGKGLYSSIEHIKDSVKYAVVQGAIFEGLGFKYLGPVDGHNINQLIEAMELAKKIEEPVMIHVITKKGKGYRNAELNPDRFHGIAPFDPTTGMLKKNDTSLSYSQVFGNKMVQLAQKDSTVVAVCAAMCEGTGLEKFSLTFPNRFFDVGIAESHGVTFSAGLAASGLKPVVAIYSTFLQRAYDQIMIDVCMQNLPVVFAIDRAGNVGADGETHHGIFDLSYLNHMPNMTVLAPADGEELASMFEYALSLGTPCAIRYPRGKALDLDLLIPEYTTSMVGKSNVIYEGAQVEIWAVGKMVAIAHEACDILKNIGVDVGLVNVATVKPLDKDELICSTKRTQHIIVIEDNVIEGGYGQQLLYELSENNIEIPTLLIGWPNKFVEHGSDSELFSKYKLDATGIAERVRDFIERKA